MLAHPYAVIEIVDKAFPVKDPFGGLSLMCLRHPQAIALRFAHVDGRDHKRKQESACSTVFGRLQFEVSIYSV
jgi:hypothetical protein